ncbi:MULTISPECIES: AAA family ATPase [Parabacteroides]|uniref:AAA family ATPase n=1 Tax=Parabacteroides TaxID=375288 RepID=UPI000EFFE3F5|nr:MULTISPECIES: ATP-binding protein [Parabacteroides]RHU30394.1 ATP-binding protein [Parabacteroides sp. TM07-1AC]WFE83674.1 ATP-binding protein [Parabacteroides chongii]
MDYFLTNIKVNKVFHLENFNIPIDEKEKKHLIITGKNGSGKTILLNAILDYLEALNSNDILHIDAWKKEKISLEHQISDTINKPENRNTSMLKSALNTTNRVLDKYTKAELTFNNIYNIKSAYDNHELVITFYEAERISEMIEPLSPVKPDLRPINNIKEKKVSEFLKFLVDYKIQEALARNEQQIEDADKINQWFIEFEKLLQSIFEDKSLKLIFNYKDYSFKIQTVGKEFKFTELSAGYSAVIDIVTDLILKMQTPDILTRTYEKQGIVLIDEIETHLHLGLQRIILPLLTHIFPNIQFIVTTHSPFILNSLPNAVAFDLERKESIGDLTDYSYEALAEGYFGVRSDSSYLQIKLDTLKSLVQKTELTISDKIELEELVNEFEQISDVVAPAIKSEYYDIKRNLSK